MSISSDGNWLSVGGSDGSVSVFDMSGMLVYKQVLYGGDGLCVI